MKSTYLILSLAAVAIIMSLIVVGCGPAPNNGNLNTNVNTNSNVAVNSVSANSGETSLTSSACSGNINDKLDKVKAAIAKDIAKKSGLQSQIDNGTFKYVIQIGPGSPGKSLDMYLEGAVGGKDNFGDLIDIIKDFVKSDCTNRVVFVKQGTLSTPITPANMIDDFEWFVCEEGTVPCPGGRCLPQCVAPSPTVPKAGADNDKGPKPNTTTNRNVNSGNKTP